MNWALESVLEPVLETVLETVLEPVLESVLEPEIQIITNKKKMKQFITTPSYEWVLKRFLVIASEENCNKSSWSILSLKKSIKKNILSLYRIFNHKNWQVKISNLKK